MNSPAIKVLVVEDNPTSLSLLEIALARQGYSVVAAEDAEQARQHLGSAKINSIGCVVTDYLMPNMNGLELLAWIRERDPGLATILVTAQGEKKLVAESLRGGAFDFLDKPVDLQKLYAAVARAVAQTSHRRQMAQSESAVKEIGLTQKRMLEASISRCREILQVHYYPKHEAGGDFFTHFQPQADQLYCVLTDVSGHDLHAAYVSAYFQGFVRGLSKRGATMEEVCSDFNRFLLEELNDASALPRGTGAETSMAVCAVLLDFAARTVTVFTQGTPAPVYLPPDGGVHLLGESGGAPLGWFSALALRGTVHSIAEGGSFLLWTDGLEDLAERQDVSVLSLAHAVRRARDQAKPLPCLATAKDDVLLAVIHLSAENRPCRAWWPVLAERYHGGQLAEIDRLQAYWRRSLTLALPELPEAQLHDVLLAAREAVLNALQHGCGGSAHRTADFQVAYNAAQRAVRVRVEDPGPGHEFDLLRHERFLERELVDVHRGLILVKHLASHLRFERKGATVVMDFGVPTSACQISE